jgi:CRISPR-associated protein Cmr2
MKGVIMDELIVRLLKTAEKERDDHAQFTSAIAFCLGHERSEVDEQLLRLAALSHEKSGDEKEELKAEVLDYADFLSQAWEMLEKQKQALDRTTSPTDFVLQPPDDDSLAVLYWAHMAASARMGGGASYTDSEGKEICLPTSEEMARHPLRERGQVALVYGGATKIKGYVFESARLPEIRGASTLLDLVNLVDLPALFGCIPKDTGEKERYKAVRERFGWALNAPECLIYASGGNILALTPASLAEKLAATIERIYAEETLVANCASVVDTFSLLELQYGLKPTKYWVQEYEQDIQNNDLAPILQARYGEGSFEKKKVFAELVTKLIGDFNRRREGREHIPHFETVPYARRCSSCDRRAAICRAPVDTEERYLCEACARKYRVGQLAKKGERVRADWWDEAQFAWQPVGVRAWIHRFEQYLEKTSKAAEYYGTLDSDKMVSPDDLDDIAAAATPEGFIGVISGDGNNLSAHIERIETLTEYRQFADRVYWALQAAVFEAIFEHLPPHVPREGQLIYPFEILSIGGDDVFLIVPAEKAIPVAKAIAENFEETLGRKLEPPRFEGRWVQRYIHYNDQGQEMRRELIYEPRVSLSAGVVIADAHTPVFFLQNLADDLLRKAKSKAKAMKKDYGGGTVDFLALKSTPMIASGVKEFREAALKREDCSLTARPYTLPEIEGLLRTIAILKGTIPRSQLQAIRDLLFGGRIAASVSYLYFASRRGDDREMLQRNFDLAWCERAAPPWRQLKPGKYETVLLDMLEIYDFVEEKL